MSRESQERRSRISHIRIPKYSTLGSRRQGSLTSIVRSYLHSVTERGSNLISSQKSIFIKSVIWFQTIFFKDNLSGIVGKTVPDLRWRVW